MVNHNSSPEPNETQVPEHLEPIVAEFGSIALRATVEGNEYSGSAAEAAARCPFAQNLDTEGFYEFIADNLDD